MRYCLFCHKARKSDPCAVCGKPTLAESNMAPIHPPVRKTILASVGARQYWPIEVIKLPCVGVRRTDVERWLISYPVKPNENITDVIINLQRRFSWITCGDAENMVRWLMGSDPEVA